MMRLTNQQRREATEELMRLVKENPGIRTGDLIGTPRFHGERTLTTRQVTKLLREAGATSRHDGSGSRTFNTWRLR